MTQFPGDVRGPAPSSAALRVDAAPWLLREASAAQPTAPVFPAANLCGGFRTSRDLSASPTCGRPPTPRVGSASQRNQP